MDIAADDAEPDNDPDDAKDATARRKSLLANGEVSRREGKCAHCHRGRVVVDSQSMMHV